MFENAWGNAWGSSGTGGGITINCPIKVKVSPEDTKIISEKPCNPRVNVLDSTLIKVMVEED